MVKKTITFTDYEGVERTEDFYFNLSKAEIAEMELSIDGGLAKKVDRIVAAQDNKEIIAVFKELILMSHGVKSDDGRRFIKNDELRAGFVQTEAYSELFMELASNSEAAIKFFNGIVPVVKDNLAKPNAI